MTKLKRGTVVKVVMIGIVQNEANEDGVRITVDPVYPTHLYATKGVRWWSVVPKSACERAGSMTEQQRWLESDPETRGMSPDEQAKRPLGYPSKRAYRESSVYGYQDTKREQKRREGNFDILRETFGEDDDGHAGGFIIGSDPKQFERDMKLLERIEETGEF